jgi:type II secretory pathway component PulF
MSKFLFEAADKDGIVKHGEFEAFSSESVIKHLEAENLIPISVKMVGGKKDGMSSALSSTFFESVTPLDRIMFIRNLAVSTRAGLNIIEALDIMIADTSKKIMKDILQAAKSNLQAGLPLYRTFEEYQEYFPVVFTGMIKAGESSGDLDNILNELADNLVKEFNLMKKVKSALTYPALLLVVTILIVIGLIVFVVPKMAQSFKLSGAELPATTQLMISIGNVITYSPILDMVVLAGLYFGSTYFMKTSFGKRAILRVIMKTPVASELFKKIALVRFTRTLSGLLKSGTPIIEALRLSSDSTGNEFYKIAILESMRKIKSGIELSKTLSDYPHLFPRFLVGLMSVGEKTGTMDNILKTFSSFYDDEVDNSLKSFVSLVEPLMLLIMGGVVGLIAISVLSPIYQLVSGGAH